MQTNELNRRLIRLLAHERALHGHGSAAAIDQQIGKSEGYLGRVLRGEIGLQTEMMFRVMDALEIDPTAFFATLTGLKRDPERCLDRLARGLADKSETPFIRVPETFQRHLDGVLNGQPELPAEAAPSLDPSIWSERLQDLDAQRFVDPEAARDRLAQWLPEILRSNGHAADEHQRAVLVRALGIAASVERVAGRARYAVRYLRAALSMESSRSSPQFAELLQRGCYQMGDQGDYATALDLALQATDIYLQAGDLYGVGRSLVDRAVMAFKVETPQATLDLYRAGLRYLPDQAWQNRFAALQGMGMTHLNLGQVDEAERCARLAARVHRTEKGLNWWRLVWLQAEVAFRQHDLPRAMRLYGDVREAFEAWGHALDAALLSLQMARVLVVSGKLQDMQHLAARTLSLLKPLRRHPIACAVLNDFARLALTGELSVQWIERLSARLETGHPEGRGAAARLKSIS